MTIKTIKQRMMRMIKPIMKPVFCILSGVLLFCCFPPLNLGYLILPALLPVLSILKTDQYKQNTLYAIFTGCSFFLPLLYWLGHVTLPGMLLLVVYASAWFALPLVFYPQIKPVWLRPVGFGLLWAGVEYLRTFGYFSFAWGFLGHSLYSLPLLLPVMSTLNVPLASGIIACLSASAWIGLQWIESHPRYLQWSASLRCVTLGLGIVTLVFPLWLIHTSIENGRIESASPPPPVETLNGQTLRVALLQGNFAMEVKNEHDTREAIEVYLDLAHQAMQQQPQLIVLPESAISVPLNYSPEIVEQIMRFVNEQDVEMLVGGVHGLYIGQSQWQYWNRAYLFSPGQTWDTSDSPILFSEMQTYDKMHLVPYGEWIPGGELPLFSWIETLIEEAGAGIFQRGTEQTVFRLRNGTAFSTVICFESTLSAKLRKARQKGVQFLVVITNDAWFKRSPGLEQHFLQSVFRAVENRCYLLRTANTGITAVIRPDGRTQSRLADNEMGYLVDDIVIK